MKPKYLHIAIDGPVASGTSTVARMLAKELGITYINTGAMYRALTLVCLREGIHCRQTNKVIQLLKQVEITVELSAGDIHRPLIIRLNGEDVTEYLHAPGISRETPKVAAMAQVRRIMVARQQELAQNRSVVMEGRDISLRVLPDAHLKIFLTATLEERAKRLFLQHQTRGSKHTFDEELADVRRRDHEDMTRAIDPLQKTPDAWEIDTTHLPPEVVVAKIMAELRRRELL